MRTWLNSFWPRVNKRPNPIRRPRLESLEKRDLLAGNVSAFFTSGGLVLSGDQLGNGVQISQRGPSSYIISGFHWQGAATTINGRSSIAINSLGTSLSIDLRGGSDALAITNATLTESMLTSPTSGFFQQVKTVAIPRDVSVFGGDGDDILVFGSVSVGRDALLSGGRGTDHIFLAYTSVGDDLTITGDAGDDRFTIANSSIRDVFSLFDGDGHHRVNINSVNAGSADVNVGLGNDSVNISDFALQGHLNLNTGSGNDLVNLTRISTSSLSVDTASGNDSLSVFAMTVGTNASLRTGDGSDTILVRGSSTGQSNRVGGSMTVDAGSGNDVVTVESLFVGQNFALFAGSGDDRVSTNLLQVVRTATLDTGSGTDTLTLNATAADALFAQLGSGDRDILTVSNSRANRAVFDGGIGIGDRFVDRRGNRFGVSTLNNFELVVRA